MELLSGQNLAALITLPGVGEKRAVALAERFGDWASLIAASRDELIAVLGPKTGQAVAEHQPTRPLTVTLPDGVRVTSCHDPDYPTRLRALPGRPTLVWWTGTLPTEGPALAVVGTRTPNTFGANVARFTAMTAARHDIATVSGLALGVDSRCHSGSLDAGQPTWAVLGQGIDTLPRTGDRAELAARILANGGGLLSEVPPGTPVAGHLLVRRNRLQSGLSNATVIAQTGLATGSKPAGTLHTARFALTQGRYLAVALPPTHLYDDSAVAGNMALASPYGMDPEALHAADPTVAALIRARAPVADLIVAVPADLDTLWAHIANIHAVSRRGPRQ